MPNKNWVADHCECGCGTDWLKATAKQWHLVEEQTHERILQWLVDNNIVRPAMDQRDGWVALNCYTGQPFTFKQLGEPNAE